MDKIREWLLLNGINLVVDLVVFLIILVVGKIAIGICCDIMRNAIRKSGKMSPILEGFLVNVVHKVLWFIVVMIGLQRLGIDIGPLIAGLGVTGFVIGFAFQETLGNLAAGLMIAVNRPFRIDDFVEVAGISGIVKEVNMMATTLNTLDNKKVVIPNGKVWGSAVTNFTGLETRRVDTAVGISYGSDIGHAKKVIRDALKQIPEILPEPAPDIEVVEMGDSAVNLVVRPWCNTADYWTVFFKTHQQVKEALDKNHVAIPFPQMDVHHHGLPSASH